MDSFAKILADARQSRKEALELVDKVIDGYPLAPGMTKDRMLTILSENIASYDQIIQRLGWREA